MSIRTLLDIFHLSMLSLKLIHSKKKRPLVSSCVRPVQSTQLLLSCNVLRHATVFFIVLWFTYENRSDQLTMVANHSHTVHILCQWQVRHYIDVIMSAMASQITNCLLSCLFRRRSKETSKLRVTGLCERNSPVTGEFLAQRQVTRRMFPLDDVIMKLAPNLATHHLQTICRVNASYILFLFQSNFFWAKWPLKFLKMGVIIGKHIVGLKCAQQRASFLITI